MRLVYGLGLAYLIMIPLQYHTTRSFAETAGEAAHVDSFRHLDMHDVAARWFREARAHCNPLEVRRHLTAKPPPPVFPGPAFGAACHALANDVQAARRAIRSMPEKERWRAAGVIFEIVHPLADAGDESLVGPLMELVVEFWPNHYMALFHAGSARHAAGDGQGARPYLERFLDEYGTRDRRAARARKMLEEGRSE